MATPASRFHARPGTEAGPGELPLRLPPGLAAVPAAAPSPAQPPVAAVEIDRVMPASGNMFAGGRQIWLGKPMAGQQVTIRLDSSALHVLHQGRLLKTHPVTLDSSDLTRLRAAGGRLARPAPAAALPPGPLPPDVVVEVERTLGEGGCVSIGGKQVSAGLHAGQRVTLRIDHQLLHVITADGVLARTLPSPLPPAARGRLHGARLGGPPPAHSSPVATEVSRVVSGQGTLMVAGIKLQVGHAHRGKVVTVAIDDNQFRILHDGIQLSAHPRLVIKEVTRRSASGHANYEI